MKKITSMLLMTLLAGILMVAVFGVPIDVRASPDLPSDMPVVFVDPIDPVVAPGDNLIISVKIFNLTNVDLYGLDIILTWDPTILNYTSHTKTIPVDTYPDGILNAPTLALVNLVDAGAGTYNVAESTLGGLPFNNPGANSTVFNMTFSALALGMCNLTITQSDIANQTANPIPHHIIDSEVTVIPEFPSMVFLPLLMTAALLVVLISKKKIIAKAM